MMKISLGCGERKMDGYVGLDVVDFGWNKVWDARKDPIPAEDNTVDLIEAFNFIEHVSREYWPHLFNECHRVIGPNGYMHITVPDAARDFGLAIQDPTHLAFVTMGTFTSYIAGGRPRNATYAFKKWEIISAGDDPKDSRCIEIRMKPKK